MNIINKWLKIGQVKEMSVLSKILCWQSDKLKRDRNKYKDKRWILIRKDEYR